MPRPLAPARALRSRTHADVTQPCWHEVFTLLSVEEVGGGGGVVACSAP